MKGENLKYLLSLVFSLRVKKKLECTYDFLLLLSPNSRIDLIQDCLNNMTSN